MEIRSVLIKIVQKKIDNWLYYNEVRDTNRELV